MTVTGGSIYGDENAFGLVFVTGAPFLFYLGLYYKSKWVRYPLLCMIPLCLHSVFLTASRGALLGAAVTVAVGIMRSRRKLLGIILLPLALGFYEWQAGDVMRERQATIAGYEEEGSAQARLRSWRAGLRMMNGHPLTGAGLGSYMTAFREYGEGNPLVAHSTLIQHLGESGVGAGMMYVMCLSS